MADTEAVLQKIDEKIGPLWQKVSLMSEMLVTHIAKQDERDRAHEEYRRITDGLVESIRGNGKPGIEARLSKLEYVQAILRWIFMALGGGVLAAGGSWLWSKIPH